MTDTTIPAPVLPDAPDAQFETLTRSVGELRDDMARIESLTRDIPTGAAAVDPLREYATLGEYSDAVYREEVSPALLNRALVDQISGDNPGVIPPGWVKDVKGIIQGTSPTVTSFGTAPLPPAGMDINWPYFAGDLTALVGAQAVEKTEITTVEVSLLKGTEALATFAGGSDISYQLIRRSDPSYRDAYMRIMSIGYAAATEAAANAAAVADATTGDATWDPALGTLAELRAALIESSIAVEAATGQPATFVLAASDVYLAIAKLTDEENYNPRSSDGVGSASTLNFRVSGLNIIHAQYSAAASMIVSNSSAASWHGEGPMTATSEDVAKLGQNVAVWGMGAFAAYLPAGIILVDDGVA